MVKIDFHALELNRKKVMELLLDKNVGTQVHYIPVNTLPYYRNISQDECPEADKYYEQCLSIPLYPSMSDNDVDTVIDAIISLKN